MGRFGVGVAALIAASALVAAGPAAASLPEIGRCVNVGSHGNFRGPKCVRKEPGIGRWEWIPGPGAKRKFAGTLPEPIVLETHGALPVAIKCSSGVSEGEYTGAKTLTLTKTVLSGCKAPAKNPIEGFCQGSGSLNGEIELKALTGELGFIPHPGKIKAGADLKPASGENLAVFECGGASESLGRGLGTGTPYELQGSVIEQLTPVNGMTTAHVISAETKGAAQVPERLEGGVKDTLTVLASTKKVAEPATLLARTQLKLEERLQILVRCVGICP